MSHYLSRLGFEGGGVRALLREVVEGRLSSEELRKMMEEANGRIKPAEAKAYGSSCMM